MTKLTNITNQLANIAIILSNSLNSKQVKECILYKYTIYNNANCNNAINEVLNYKISFN
jgi:hypothetical protein